MTVGIDAYPQALSRILRFDRVQRAAHWANALLFELSRDATRAVVQLAVGEIVEGRCVAAIGERPVK